MNEVRLRTDYEANPRRHRTARIKAHEQGDWQKNEEEFKQIFQEVMVAVRSTHFSNRVMHFVELPQKREPMLGPMKPIINKVSQEGDAERCDNVTDKLQMQKGRLCKIGEVNNSQRFENCKIDDLREDAKEDHRDKYIDENETYSPQV